MSRVKAGEAYVEIGGDPRKLFATLSMVQRQIGQMGSAFSATGRQMMAVGAGLAAPFGIAAAAGSRFQDVLLNVKASTGATAAELEQVKSAAMAMSQSLGVGPTEAAAGFLELLKAGMSLEQVLGGAGKAATQFAKVGGMAVADAAVVMSDAMNVFKVDAATAANTISSAADASSTSIELLSQSFTQVSAVAGLANQSIQDTAAALAVLANAGVKGSDAGTSLKTMLMRLMAPAEDAVGAMQQLGLTVQSFRNADGTMKPMVEIIRTLSTALEGMDQAAKDDIFRRIFGQDAIRAAAVMTAAGVDGFNAMRDGMDGAMTVGDKFATMSSGLSGAASTLKAAFERLAITVSDAVGPAIMGMAQAIAPVIDGITKFVSANKELVGQIARGVTIFTAAGAGLFVLGKALSFTSAAFGGILGTAGGVFSVLKTVAGGALFVGNSFAKAITGILAFRVASITSAVASGAAWAIANAPLLILLGLLGGLAAFAVNAMGGFNALAGAIGGYFKGAIADAQVVFGDLYKIGKETLGGIYDAIANGDLAGAMQILTAGLQAIWTRSIEALLHTWHSAVGEIKKAFVTIGSAWDTYVTKPISLFGVRVAEAAQERAVLGSFDTTQGTIFDNESKKQARGRKKVAEDLLNSQSVESFQTNKARAQAEIAARQAVVDAGNAPGATEEQKKAATEAVKEIQAFREAINLVRARFAQLGMKTPEERQAEVNRRRAEVDAQTEQNQAGIDMGGRAAQEKLDNLTRGQRESRVFRDQADEAINQLGSATTMEQVRQIAEEFHLLAETGRLTAEQQKKYAEAVEAAQERIETGRGEAGVGEAAVGDAEKVDPESVQNAAEAGAKMQAEIAGTFSAMAATQFGSSGSVQQKQLTELQGIHQELKKDNSPRVAA